MIKRVIMHSGSPLWDTPDNTIDGPKKANEFAEIFGCANRTRTFDSDREGVLSCLGEVDAEEMYTKSFEVKIENDFCKPQMINPIRYIKHMILVCRF